MDVAGGSVWFSLEIRADTPLNPVEPDSDVIKFRVRIVPHVAKSSDKWESAIGHFDVWRFNVGAYLDRLGRGVFSLFDAEGSEAAALHSWLFDKNGHFKKALGLDAIIGTDILHFCGADFHEEYGESKVVLAAAERIIQVLGGGCAVATLWPWGVAAPVIAKADPDKLETFWIRNAESEAFWRRIGFKRVPQTQILLRNLARVSSPIRELLK